MSGNVEDWVRETMHRLEEQMKELTGSVADVRERLIRMEATATHGHGNVESLDSKVEQLIVRVHLLEAEKLVRAETGRTVGHIADWAHKLAPWIFAMALVAFSNWRAVIAG